ncbi:MAG: hypothetical protein FWD34_06290 [Oscillospiraceae bacterium]|nr:hypothetical protein [Oscillospiraceae bacterium]
MKCKCSKAPICFPPLCFTEEGVYCYKIAEQRNPCSPWRTDCKVFRVIITITRDKNGELQYKIRYPDGYPTFVNCYCPKPCCKCK